MTYKRVDKNFQQHIQQLADRKTHQTGSDEDYTAIVQAILYLGYFVISFSIGALIILAILGGK